MHTSDVPTCQAAAPPRPLVVLVLLSFNSLYFLSFFVLFLFVCFVQHVLVLAAVLVFSRFVLL